MYAGGKKKNTSAPSSSKGGTYIHIVIYYIVISHGVTEPINQSSFNEICHIFWAGPWLTATISAFWWKVHGTVKTKATCYFVLIKQALTTLDRQQPVWGAAHLSPKSAGGASSSPATLMRISDIHNGWMCNLTSWVTRSQFSLVFFNPSLVVVVVVFFCHTLPLSPCNFPPPLCEFNQFTCPRELALITAKT